MPSTSYQTLLDYSFRILGGKSYTEAEITKKLLQRAKKLKLTEHDNAIAKVMERLRELAYLDDKRILENYFEYRLKTRPKGRFLFLHEMHRRGIPFEIAAAEWDKRKIDESALAEDLLSRKKRAWIGLPHVLRKKKAGQFLAGRGFSTETVWEIVGKI